MSATDAVRASVVVRLPPMQAFRLFTTRIDAWWRRGPQFRRAAASGLIHLEPGVGGRLFESWDTDGGEVVAEVGRVLRWEPPRALEFTWRGANFEPHQQTWVEVCFEPHGGGTQVTVVHRGWDGLPPDAPVRHGQASEAFLRGLGLWWAGLLVSLRVLGATDATNATNATDAAAGPPTIDPADSVRGAGRAPHP